MSESTAGDRSRRAFLGQVAVAAGACGLLGARRGAAQAAGYPGSTPDPGTAPPATPSGAASAAAPPAAGAAADSGPPAPGAWFPQQDPALVQRVVAVSHGDLAAVRELVSKRPELAKAQWDWGFGDWESALDAASHTGRREIALLLLAHGARPTIFSAAMLGQLAVVESWVALSPGIQSIPGPHGIPLLAHARAGGAPAAAVVAYLETLGGADGGPPAAQPSAAESERYLGSYRFGPGPRDLLEVAIGGMGLGIARAGSPPRRLLRVGDHTFHPAGAPSVRVRFEVAGEQAVSVAIHDPDLLVSARRAG